MRRLVLLSVVASIMALLVLQGAARADAWDLNLGRLCQLQLVDKSVRDCGGGYSGPPGMSQVHHVIPDNAAFRSLMSELGVVFAPNILQPADTQGFSGFNVSAEFGWTMINPKKVNNRDNQPPQFDKDGNQLTIKGSHWYWRAAQSVSYRHFEGGDITGGGEAEVARDNISRELPSSFAPTISLMARKGLWIPVPSFEMGVGVKHLIGSRMWGPMVQAKVALHEGFQGWPLPAFAVRGSGVRVVGSPQFNLTVVGLDFSISKHFGVASTFNLTPYAGYQLLWIIADSEVLDATPAVDAMSQTAKSATTPLDHNRCQVQDCNGNFTFADQANITRHRAFFGLKANFFVASLLLEYSYFASGAKSDEVVEKAGATEALKLVIPDDAGSQHNISFSIEIDF
jgi:hypothetical protein